MKITKLANYELLEAKNGHGVRVVIREDGEFKNSHYLTLRELLEIVEFYLNKIQKVKEQ